MFVMCGLDLFLALGARKRRVNAQRLNAQRKFATRHLISSHIQTRTRRCRGVTRTRTREPATRPRSASPHTSAPSATAAAPHTMSGLAPASAEQAAGVAPHEFVKLPDPTSGAFVEPDVRSYLKAGLGGSAARGSPRRLLYNRIHSRLEGRFQLYAPNAND